MAKTKRKSTKKKTIKKQHTAKALLSKKNALIILGVIFFLTFLAFSPLINSTFLNYDDDIYITENIFIRDFSISNLPLLFSGFLANQYSPVAMTIMGLEVAMLGMNASNLKIISILFHLLNAFLVFRFISLLFKRTDLALIVAAIFCVHPMQLESVAWLAASMKIEAFACFFLLSLICYTQYLNKKMSSFYYGAALIFFLLSCFSKEQAVSLAVTLFAIDYLRGRSLLNSRVWLEKIPFLAIAVIFGWMTLSASSGIERNATAALFGVPERLLFVSFTSVAYLVKIAIPFNLSFLYFFPLKASIPITYYLSPLLFIPLVYLLYYSIRKDYKVMAFGMLFFGINIGLAIFSQAFAVRDVIMADRYVYLPVIGTSILLSFGLLEWVKKKPGLKTPIFMGLGIYVLVLLFLSFQRTTVWKNSITVFSDAIEKAASKELPILSLAYGNLGLAKKNNGDIDGAMAAFNQAITLNKADYKSFLNRGNIYFNNGQWDLAIADYNKSEAASQSDPKIYSSRGAAYGSKGIYDLAIKDLTKALELDPSFTDASKNRSVIYFSTRQFEVALQDCNHYLSYVPNDARMVHHRGLVYGELGRLGEAEADVNRAIQLDPNKGEFYLTRSRLSLNKGNKTGALSDAQKALNLGAKVSEEYLNSLR